MSITSLQNLIDSGVKLTPMMEQYYSIKKNYLEHLLLFRMGDFYEVFFEDATKVSQSLNITLTHRGKIGHVPIPMAGIPHHAASTYIDRLTNAGMRVAICEQIQDPSEAKGIVKRGVTQVVSPGIPYDLDKAEGKEHRYLAAGLQKEKSYYLITIDFTTGEFLGQKFEDPKSFLDRLHLLSPKELITYMGQWAEMKELDTLCEAIGTLKTHLSCEYFEAKHTSLYLEKLIPGYKQDKVIKTSSEVLGPIGALAYYISSTQQLEDFVHIRPFKLLNNEKRLKATLSTLTGLEVLPKTRDSYKDSLLGFLDRTQTAMGSRRLRRLITEPLQCRESIIKRQDFIQFFLQENEILQKTRETLGEIRDIERILAKVSTNKANAGDLINITRSIKIYSNLDDNLKEQIKKLLPPPNSTELSTLKELSKKIEKTINDEIGASLDKGNLIKPGCHSKRDRLAQLNCDASGELCRLAERYRKETGIQKLRVKSNNVAGYFIEVSKIHTDKVPSHFERKQTLVNSERYTTEELGQFEKEMISAKEKLQRLEREIFKNILSDVSYASRPIQKLTDTLSFLDCFLALAWTSHQEEFSRPTLKKSKGINLRGVWHPLIKNVLFDEFIPHDLTLNEKDYFGLITGPNMAGKTTVMRETAIVQILTQMGCYVPAKKAELSLCDYLFSRLGASDDILKGQSTFMVEMTETAEIIRHATKNSMVILDEVGRGTSTYDGLSIAWALVEHLVANIRPLGLFATHYHELIELVEGLPGAKNFTVETRNVKGDVQFLYRLVEGGANQSFGIYVAKLAGLPAGLLKRSQQILNQLEKGNHSFNSKSKKEESTNTQLSFFENECKNASSLQETSPHLLKLKEELKKLDLSRMTPLEALNKLHGIQKMTSNDHLQ